ncbi:MAG: M23 family metallopeptidase, partial [Chitinophagales bacterium]
MKQLTILVICCVISTTAFNQTSQQFSGGEYNMTPLDEMSPEQRATIFQMLEENEAKLQAEGKLPMVYNKTATVALQFPLAWNDGFEGYNFYAISNYVDHDNAYPNSLEDWNCGERTYDTESGYNHQGIDYFLWPFDWNLTNAGAVKIVAAAPGTIVGKYDGNFDQNCAFNPGSWNAIYVKHTDGSTAWYGHMKKSSLTAKGLGETVEVGEYLGTVGSSGNSTGPHLHFEMYNDDNNLIDPFEGTCNTMNVDTWWADQDPYIKPEINRVQTHSAPPEFMPCPEPAITHESNNFMPGSECYFVFYAKDLSPTDLCNLTITKADGEVWYDWDFYQPDYYLA